MELPKAGYALAGQPTNTSREYSKEFFPLQQVTY